MLASVRSAGATCWPLSESCWPSSCPFLLNMHLRSSCPPPLYLRCYSALIWRLVFPLPTTLSNLGLMPPRDTCIPFWRAMLFGKPHSVITELTTQQQTLSSCICYIITSNSVHLNGMFYVLIALCGCNFTLKSNRFLQFDFNVFFLLTLEMMQSQNAKTDNLITHDWRKLTNITSTWWKCDFSFLFVWR